MNLQTLYQELFKPVFAYVLCRVRDYSAAEDICATAWRKAYEKQSSFDPQKGSFRQWIFTIARNEINMYHRLYYVRKFLSLTGFEEQTEFPQPVQEDPAQQNGDIARLLGALQHLKERERDLVALKFYSGLNNREIALQTGLSESNVGTILNRSIGKLRKEMNV